MPEYKCKITIEVTAYIHADSEEEAENAIYDGEIDEQIKYWDYDITNVNAEHHRD